MTEEQKKDSMPMVKVIYILLIISTIVGLTGILAAVLAYVFKDDAEDWLQTHYRFQIRTFWIGLLYFGLGAFLLQVGIGVIILICAFFWLVIRCAKGLKQLENRQPVKNLESWFLT
jgi:uncharacterized membrane protein